MMTELLLGVDGGGTSTTAWLADTEGRVLGRGVGGPSNAKAIGLEAARVGLDQAVQFAFAKAGIEVRSVAVACLGLAGFDRPDDRYRLEFWASESPWNGRLILVNDGDLVVAAGTPDAWGVGLIAGTGSIAVGRDREGRTARAGGWGYLLGDEGSGYAVALAGLRKVARQADGRDPAGHSALTDRFCESLGIGSTSELVTAVYRDGFDRAKIASLAPIVVAAAEDDPSILIEILEPAGKELALMVEAVARKLEFSPGRLPLAMAGSFLLNCGPISRLVPYQLAARGYEVASTFVADPVKGAITLARRSWIAWNSS
jgi:N-acetylglucosamine kinase-like BadF-type ATPase